LHIVGGNAQLQDVYYFSALAKHLEASKPDVTKRHEDLLTCLRSTGVKVELSRFKKKTVLCDFCGNRLVRHEEKETDTAIAVKLLELMFTNACDTVVVMTGDTDLAPAVRSAQTLFPGKTVRFAFPYRRKNKELAKLAGGSFDIRKEHYVKHQLPDPFVAPDGQTIPKPAGW
jgi:hypothetical protein